VLPDPAPSIIVDTPGRCACRAARQVREDGTIDGDPGEYAGRADADRGVRVHQCDGELVRATHTGSAITDYDLRYHEGSADPTNEEDWIEDDETTGLPDASTSATNSGLNASTAYRVQVRTQSRGAPGSWSASAPVITGTGTGTNNAPTRAARSSARRPRAASRIPRTVRRDNSP